MQKPLKGLIPKCGEKDENAERVIENN